MSYPDLIEVGEPDGRYWVTETQKTVARVHEIDKTLLEGLWQQGRSRTVTAAGRLLDLDAKQLRAGEAAIGKRLNLRRGPGLSLDFWVRLKDLAAGQVLLDDRDGDNRGLAVTTTEAGTLRIELSDGKAKAAWESDRGLFQPDKRHHVAIILDSGPKIIGFVVDGVLCDGGADRQFGWARWPGDLGDVSGAGKLRLAPALQRLRVYDRPLRTSEAIAHFHADP